MDVDPCEGSGADFADVGPWGDAASEGIGLKPDCVEVGLGAAPSTSPTGSRGIDSADEKIRPSALPSTARFVAKQKTPAIGTRASVTHATRFNRRMFLML